jgi:signal peptidase II
VSGGGTGGMPAGRPFRRLFALLALAVVAADQGAKAWVLGAVTPGKPVEIAGDWFRITFVQNSGALFGLFQDRAILFAVSSVAVMAVIVLVHERTGRNLPLSIALGLLLGGAVGNFIDRLRFGYVVDFVDMGVGVWRFYTYNVADAAITTALIVLIVVTLLPGLAERLTPDA